MEGFLISCSWICDSGTHGSVELHDEYHDIRVAMRGEKSGDIVALVDSLHRFNEGVVYGGI